MIWNNEFSSFRCIGAADHHQYGSSKSDYTFHGIVVLCVLG